MNSDEIPKMELLDEMPDVPFEEIMLNGNTEQFNCSNEDSSTCDSFHNGTNHSIRSQPAKHKKSRNEDPSASHSIEHHTESSNPMAQLQMDLLKSQIAVQELMAVELKLKIERTQKLMKLEAAESELRCEEIRKRLQS